MAFEAPLIHGGVRVGSISGNYSVLLNVCCKMSIPDTAVIVQIVAQLDLQRVDDQPSVIFFAKV